MTDNAHRIRATVPRHVSRWEQQQLPGYLGGPFADQTGGLIIFQAETVERAERTVNAIRFSGTGSWRPTG